MSNPNPFQATNPANPLTYQHLSDINAALRALDQAEAAANQAKSAGLDMAQQLQTIQAQRQQLLQIKNVYFPGQ